MLSYITTKRNPRKLKLGRRFKHVHYEWKPFDRRLPDHKEDYVRLFNHIQSYGIQNPLIIYGDAVLIGQRRCEIAQILQIPLVDCWEIQTDITMDDGPERVEELKRLYMKVNY